MHVPGDSAAFDKHRNSSRVFPIAAGALEDSLRTFAWARQTQPEWYRWVAAGCPELTVDEYEAVRPKRKHKRAASGA